MSKPLNFNSPEWDEVFAEAQEEINRCVQQLISPDCTHDQALMSRGKIAALRTILERDATRFSNISINPF
jgi:hypothetical protein